ncbi:InlB B-repeat-containing protein [Cohnella rhizosphaerae]|uniref:InlB B-repeat-containing protein n=1 Tax=Cohnella rhizosphaerae TaxID=1457232 RepID=A0A9X4KX52_9BACL|nr:InlB B-repeat-containing protein [Cohnella rhizosphaerae]MDG0809647.1 InlB B-repeat-containing protein [Cohnella rhizosphaerae]
MPVDDYYYYEDEEAEVLGNSRGLIKAGYTFADWNTAADGTGTAYKEGDLAPIGREDLVLHAQWTKNPTYKVHYDGNGETGGTGPVDNEEYEAGAAATVMSNAGGFVKNGYSFAGWNTKPDGDGTPRAAGEVLTIAAADVTLYAQWTANPTYSVTYEAADADSGSVPVDAGAYEEGAELTVQGNTGNLSRVGYAFADWTLAAEGSGSVYKAGDKLTIGTANITLHAKWTANPTYSVTYEAADADSGSVPVDAGAYEEGAEAIVQGNTGSLSRAGYTFAGWTLAADGGGAVYRAGDKLTMGTSDITLYAKWAANPTYGVTYEATDADSGSVPLDAGAYEEGTEVTVQGNTGDLSRVGYTFVGWTLAANGSGTVYKAGDKLTMGGTDITLYAKWTAKPTYSVTYQAADADSGSVPVDAGAYEEGAELTVQGNTGNLSRAGYTFAGWTLSADGGGTVYKAGDKLTMGGAVTLHAKWTANPTYGVTYEAADADSGSVPIDAGAYEEGAEVTVQGNTGNLVRAGYTFAGWTLSANGTGTVYKAGDKLTMGTADITLHAKWTANPTYDVTYEANDADSGSVPTDAGAYEEGAEVTVQGNTGNLARAGYTFAGWTLAANGTGTGYKAGDKLTIGRADIHLYAKWNIEAGGGPDPDPDPVAAPKLTSLHLSAGEWSAAFSPGTAEYTITVSADVDSVDVTAAAANERQSVTASVYDGEGVRIGGPIALGAESRSITLAASAASMQIGVVAEDGKGFIYLLHIQRAKTQEPETPTPPPTAPLAPTPPPFKLTIGGTEQSLVGTATMNAQDLDVQLLSSALATGLSAAAEGTLIAITAPGDALSLTVRFDASALDAMKAKRASLALVTSQGSYTLPIAELPVETADGAAYSLSVGQGGSGDGLAAVQSGSG